MTQDRFTKICLVMIVVLLAVIALRPILSPAPARAADRGKYVAVMVGFGGNLSTDEGLESALNKYAAQGKEFVAAVPKGSFLSLVFR